MRYEFDGLVGIKEIQARMRDLMESSPDHRASRGDMTASVSVRYPSSVPTVVDSIKHVTPTSKRIRLVAERGQLPYFRAGQYINVKVRIDGIHTSRAYTLSSSPSQRGYYEITVRAKEGGFVSDYLLHRVCPGDRLQLSAPDGTFYYRKPLHGEELVFLAGGSGITPFISMLRFWADTNDQSKTVTMFYGSARAADVIYLDELRELERKLSGFRLHVVISEPEPEYRGLTGFITADLIKSKLGVTEGKKFFVCGPEDMYRFVVPELEKLGVDRHGVCSEAQTPPADPTGLPGWPAGVTAHTRVTVKIEGGPAMRVSAAEPLLCSLERRGIVPPSKCRAGECGLCRTKLVSGEVFYPPSVKIRKADAVSHYIHPCMTYPVSDIAIRLHV